MSIFIENSPVTLVKMQAFHIELDEAKGFDQDPIRNVAYLTEEVGEALAAIRHFLNQTDESEIELARQQVGSELADCLAYLCKLANISGVNLERAYLAKMARNVDRTWSRPTDAHR